MCNIITTTTTMAQINWIDRYPDEHNRMMVKDAYDVVDEVMVPKDGVFGLKQNQMRTLINERNQKIQDFIDSKNAVNYDALATKDKIELANSLKQNDVVIEFLEKENALKREQLRNVEQYVRDQIFQLYTSTQGNYFKRGRSTGETIFVYKILMSMKRWLPASLINKFGGTRYLFSISKLERGHYTSFTDVLTKKLKYLMSPNRIKLGMGALEKEGLLRTQRDTLNVLAVYAMAHFLTSIAMSGGGGDDGDDEEERERKEAERQKSFMMAHLAYSALVEYSSLHPLVYATTFYNKLTSEPLKQYGQKQNLAEKIGSGVLSFAAGSTLQSVDEMLQAFDIAFSGGGPFAPFTEQNQGTGAAVAVSKIPTYNGTSRGLVGLSKLSGVEIFLKGNNAEKQLLNAIKYNPIIGFENPLGRLNEIETRRDEIKEIFDKQSIDILKVQALAKYDKKGKVSYDRKELAKISVELPDKKELNDLMLEDMALQVEKIVIGKKYKTVSDVISNRKASQSEGVRKSKMEAAAELKVTGLKTPKEEKSLATKNAEAAAKALESIQKRQIMDSLKRVNLENPGQKQKNKDYFDGLLDPK